MSDKNLTELEWKKFSKGKGCKDAAFVKALAALETGRTPEARIAALADIDKQAGALRKAHKADKALDAYLVDVEKAAAREGKAQEAQAKKAAQQASADEEEEDSPALLTTKMLPLLRQVRKGAVMHTAVALTPKAVAVLVSRRPVSPPQRKLLADHLGMSGGVRFALGEVIWEENAHTFVLKTQAAGLAKKIKAALFGQLAQRFKVRVRGEDPGDIDDDGEPPEPEEGGIAGEDPRATTAPVAPPPSPPAPPPSPDPSPPPAPPDAAPAAGEAQAPAADESAAFNARLGGLMPRIKERLAAAGPDAAGLKLKVGEAGALARKKAFAQAHGLLDEAEALMGARPATTASTAATAAAEVPRGFVNQARSRLAWQQLRQKVRQDLDALEQAILRDHQDAPDLGELAVKIRRFDGVLAALDESLADTLDAALNAADPAERLRLHGQARATLARYIDFVATDPLLRALDGNPFVPLTTHATLTKGLQVLDKSLA